ncbi:MAG: proton-conducting transporter membrane subunit, partial [Planctomycetota bacterium]
MNDLLSTLLILIPAFPLAAAILVAIAGPKLLKQWSHVPVIVALVASFVCSLGLLKEISQPKAIDTTVINVPDVKPVIDSWAVSPSSINEGDTVHVIGTYHDVVTPGPHTLTVNWGEGLPQTVAVTGGSFDVTHQYLDDNPTGTPSDTYKIGVTLRRVQPVGPKQISLVNAGYEHIVTLWTWANVAEAYTLDRPADGVSVGSIADRGPRDFRIDVTLRADALTAIMLVMVTFISTLVAIFAAGYMHGDRGYWRFFAYIGLFVFSMTMLVSVSNFILLFVFWEAVGVCSYLLIGFWYEKPEAAAAGKKAFLVNRIGDVGFALAVFLIWTNYGTLNFHDTRADGETHRDLISQAMEVQLAGDAPGDNDSLVVRGVLGRWRIAANDYVTGNVALAICLLLLLGACGKSAQFPLHVWLPDAMEGPTPVSALIHAATMVTAGVYMVTRCTPLFMASPEAQLTVAC